MSDTSPFGFGKFVPGFDFLQSLAKGAAGGMPQMPSLSSWVAPTLNVEELEKRIEELKAVQFWLEQNSRALAATIQALEVQKMTLATLQGMNFSMGDVANAFKFEASDTVFGGAKQAADALAGAAEAMAAAGRMTGHGDDAGKGAQGTAPQAEERGQDEATTSAPKAGRRNAAGPASDRGASDAKAAAKASASVVDPMQWWGALTSQFQQIAANALKDPATQTAMDNTRNLATGLAQEAFKAAGEMASQFTTAKGEALQTADAGHRAAKAGEPSGKRRHAAGAPKATATAAAKKARAAAPKRASPASSPASGRARTPGRASTRKSAG